MGEMKVRGSSGKQFVRRMMQKTGRKRPADKIPRAGKWLA
jgi:hypothetical protein